MALRARRGYLAGVPQQPGDAATCRRASCGSTSPTSPRSRRWSRSSPTPIRARVVYAIDVLESLDKRNLVTPLLLYHEAPVVRRRALAALGAVRSDIAEQWVPHIRRMLTDADPGVRAAAIGALSSIAQEDAASLARPSSTDPDPRIQATAAVALAGSTASGDVDEAERRAARPDQRHARRDQSRTPRRRHRHPPDRRSALPQAADPAALRSRRPKSPTKRSTAFSSPAPPTSFSCRRWCRCSATAG